MWIHFAGLAKVYKKKRFTATPTMRLWQYQPQKWHASRKSGRAMWEWRVKIAKQCLITACWKLDYSIMLKFTLKAHNHVWYWYQYKVTGSENLANSWNPGRSQSQCIFGIGVFVTLSTTPYTMAMMVLQQSRKQKEKAKIHHCNDKNHTLWPRPQALKLHTVINVKLYTNKARRKSVSNYYFCLYCQHGCQLVQRWHFKNCQIIQHSWIHHVLIGAKCQHGRIWQCGICFWGAVEWGWRVVHGFVKNCPAAFEYTSWNYILCDRTYAQFLIV